MPFAREMGVVGLPVTVLIDREGREVARYLGDAEWDSDAAKTLVTQLAETVFGSFHMGIRPY